MSENILLRPDAFNAFVVLFRYAECQASQSSDEPLIPFKPAALVSALRQLYNNTACQAPAYLSAPQLLAGLGQALAEQGQQDQLKLLEVRVTLQIVGLLLDAILSDTSIPASMTGYFRCLQFPLLIAAFADRSLLDAKTHPARELLNQLACFAMAANAQGEIDNSSLRADLEAALSQITVEAAEHPATFVEVLETLAGLAAPLNRSFALRLERVVDTCVGGHRLEQARLYVAKEIDASLGGKTLPKIILDLLAAGWRQLLVLTFLRQGPDSGAWRQELAVLDWLVRGQPGQANQFGDASQLLAHIMDKLHGAGTDRTTAARLGETLQRWLAGEDGLDGLACVAVPPADTEKEEKEVRLQLRLRGFSAGDWLKIAVNRSQWVPMRLTWIGKEPSRYVFVNQKGVKSLDLDAEDFVKMLDEKRASRIGSLEQLTIVERASKSLLYTLRERMR